VGSNQLLGQVHPEGLHCSLLLLPSFGLHLMPDAFLHDNKGICNADIKCKPKKVNPELMGGSVGAVLCAHLVSSVNAVHVAVVLWHYRWAGVVLDLAIP